MNLTPDEARSLAEVNHSHLFDAVRWTISYHHHTATALRRRALAAGNGHAAGEATPPAREPGS